MKKNNNTVKDYVRVKCSETATETDSVFAVVPGDNVKYFFKKQQQTPAILLQFTIAFLRPTAIDYIAYV